MTTTTGKEGGGRPRTKADAATLNYYESKYAWTLAEWRRFIAGQRKIDSAVVPREIQESWMRCERQGVRYLEKPQHRILSGQALQDLLKENESFIDTSRLFMKYLYSFMKNSPFGVTLFDRRGYLLEIMMSEEYLEGSRERNWTVGALWDEATAGNNAVGTVLTLRKPLRIFGPQHYNRSYHRDTVASAPIFDPEGTFIGGITITGFYYAQPLTPWG
jgi:transcriptional regulator of acetoin/glycerol metabolism